MTFDRQTCWTIQRAFDSMDLLHLPVVEALDMLGEVPDVYLITAPISEPVGLEEFDGQRVRIWHDDAMRVRAVVHG